MNTTVRGWVDMLTVSVEMRKTVYEPALSPDGSDRVSCVRMAPVLTRTRACKDADYELMRADERWTGMACIEWRGRWR